MPLDKRQMTINDRPALTTAGRIRIRGNRFRVQPIDDTSHRYHQWPIYRTTAGASVSPAAEILRHPRHIYLPFAAEADPILPIRQFAKENSDLHVLDRKGVIHQPFAILFARAKARHLLLGDPYPGERSLTMQIRKRRAQQPHLSRGVSKLDMSRAERRVRSRQHQFACPRARQCAWAPLEK